MNTTLNELLRNAPPGELDQVIEDLESVIDNHAGISSAADNKVAEGTIASGLVASKWNKQGGKYVCHVNKKLFNVQGTKAIDIEDFDADDVNADLVEKLELYGETHFPSNYGYTVVPKSGNSYEVIIVGSRNNFDNFYTGQWRSHWLINGQDVQGEVDVSIHYYEDGNVALNSSKKVSGTGDAITVIENLENQVTEELVDQFTEYSQKLFKNLRRTLPVTRSKINWGSAIGNYRLGSDVVNKK